MSADAGLTVYYYLDDYTDEVLPCAPVLPDWAAWLFAGDEDWNLEPVTAGSTFGVHTLTVLGDIRIDLIDGVWTPATPVPEGTDIYFLRHEQGGSGWGAMHAGEAIADAMDCMDDEGDGPFWLACVKEGESATYVFQIGETGPELVPVAEAVGQA